MIIAQGAEAVLKKEGNLLIKERISKSYRISHIDNDLRKSRTRREAKILEKVQELIPSPKVHKIDDKLMTITMDFIEGEVLRDCVTLIDKKKMFKLIGKHIKKLHDSNIIHGDLTTSNIIVKDHIPYFIDFGLSVVSTKIEDRAVDLHLLRQALESKHYAVWEECFEAVMQGYNPDKEFIERFEKVEGRGRYKHKQKSL